MTVLLGRTSAGTSTDFNGASHAAVWKFTAVASGQLATIFGQTKAANAGITSVDLAVYSDDAANARPLNRLGVATATVGVTGTGAFSATLGAPVTIVLGTVYWLGWRGVGEQFDWQGDTAGSYLEATGTGTFPDPWPAGAGAGSLNAIIWGEDAGTAVAPTVSDPGIFFDEHGPGDFGPNPFVESFATPTATSASFPQVLTATVTASATIAVRVGKILTATTTTSSSMVRQVGKTLTATATTSASMVRSVAKTLTATVTVSATLVALKVILRTLTATVTVSASMTRQVGKLLAATVTLSASMVRQVAKTLTATVTVSATLAALKVILRTMTATVTVSSSMVRQVGKPLTVTVTATASLVKQVAKRLTSTVTVSASLTALKVILKTLTATVTVTASMTRSTGKVLTATVTSAATIAKRVGKTLTTTVASIASLIAQGGTTAVIGVIDGLSRSQGTDAQLVTFALINGASAAIGDEGALSTSIDEGASGMTGSIG